VHQFISLGLAGAAGALSRYFLASFIQRFGGEQFPWGTLTVNAIGCLLFGLVWTLAEDLVISGQTRFIILTGFMGSFTTFSTFAFETQQLLRESEWLAAGFNVVGQNIVGLAAVFLGITLGRWLS